MSGPNATDWFAAELPPEAIPTDCLLTDIAAANGNSGGLEVSNDGLMMGANDGLAVRTGVLEHGQVLGPHASYEITDTGVVYLEGCVWPGIGENFAQLPPNARPTHTLYLRIHGDSGTTRLQINPDGNMYMFGAPDPMGTAA